MWLLDANMPVQLVALLQAFRAAWQKGPITPAPGRMIEWPAPLN
jgi:hypothetical protein